MKQKVLLSLVASTAMLFSSFASAQYYVGAVGGQSDASLNSSDIINQLAELGYGNAIGSVDTQGSAYRAYAGYRFNPYLAVEAGFSDFGKNSLAASVTPAGTLNIDLRTKGADISVVGSYPINSWAKTYLRAGVFDAETKASYVGTGSVVLARGQSDQSTRKTVGVFGVGALLQVGGKFTVRAEFSRTEKVGNALTGGESSIDSAMLGVEYRF